MTDNPRHAWPDEDRPSATLDLSSPAHALHLAAVAFAAELRTRSQPGRRPFFILSIQARPYLDDTEPRIVYSITDMYGSGTSTGYPTPEAALAAYLAYDPDEGEQETAS